MDAIEVVLIAAIVCILGVFSYAVYENVVAEKFSLVKSEWTCTKSHNLSTVVLVGKVIVPQNNTVCDNYQRAN